MDTLYGEAGLDVLMGGADDDQLDGGTDADLLYGGTENDTLEGGEGNDILHGDQGNDTLRGMSGNDQLLGEDDDDLLYGGDGDDTLNGNRGRTSSMAMPVKTRCNSTLPRLTARLTTCMAGSIAIKLPSSEASTVSLLLETRPLSTPRKMTLFSSSRESAILSKRSIFNPRPVSYCSRCSLHSTPARTVISSSLALRTWRQ